MISLFLLTREKKSLATLSCNHIPNAIDRKIQDAWCPITSWRENVSSDSLEIEEIMKNECTSRFGNVNVSMLIERSLFSISQVDSSGSIVSHISLFSYPNVPVVPPSDWVNWAKQLYGLNQIRSGESFFIHLMTWKRSYSSEFLRTLIDIIFLHCSFLENILVVAPPGISMGEIFEEYFTRIFPKKLDYIHNIQTLYLCIRKNHFPKISIRMALEKDHDDLWSLNEAQNEKLGSFYGENYLSEIISHSSENRILLTAKINDEVVGLMCLNNEIDLELLEQHLELKSFNGFHMPHAEDKTSLMNAVGSIKKIMGANCEKEELPTIQEDTSEENHARERYEFNSIHTCSCSGDVCYGESMLKSIQKELITSSKFKESNPLDVNDLKRSTIMFRKEFGLPEAKQDNQAMYHPSYHGNGNSLCIELLAVHSSYKDRECIDFLRSPFDLYPDYDYCLISLPLTSGTFPIINRFVRCIPKDQSEFPHDVYVLHRNAALSNISVRCYDHSDFEEVIDLLKTIEFHKEVDLNFLRSGKFGMKSCKTIIFESESTIIGFATIIEEDDLQNLKAHYKVENFLDFHHFESSALGEIAQFILCPIFHCHSKYIIREILRLTEMEFLFYRLYPSMKVYHSNIMNALGEMMPVLPRKQPLFTSTSTNGKKNIQNYFALYLINSKLTNHLSIHINARIIVVGASTTALSFLESLIFSSTRRIFIPQNITLVSPFGIPYTTEMDVEANMFALDQEFYSNEYVAKLSLCSWINTVYGYMTAIDRKKKIITIDHVAKLSYDYLIITTGEQFFDEYLKLSHIFHHTLHRKRQKDVLRNSFCINSFNEACSLMNYLRKNYHKSSSRKIIVYGHSLEAFATIETLMRCHYPGDTIVLVEDFYTDSVVMTCFGDIKVYQHVTRVMRKMGIKILRDYKLVSLLVNRDKNELTNITFSKGNDNKAFECLVLINSGIKSINNITSSAIIESSLCYHNGLIIKQDFSTNDPFIFGAGTNTRYPKQLHAKQFEHRFYNSREVGKKLHEALMHLWNPYKKQCSGANEFKFQQYRKPIIKACKVPGGNYLQIHKPGIWTPLEWIISHFNFETVLLTDGSSSKSDSYFCIHLNAKNVIEGITCCSIKNLDIGNIFTLHGKHKSFLNYLLKRYNLRQTMGSQNLFSTLWSNVIPYNGFSKIYEKLMNYAQMFEENDSDILKEIIRKIKNNKGIEEQNDFRNNENFAVNEIKKILPKHQAESALLKWIKEDFFHYQKEIPNHKENI